MNDPLSDLDLASLTQRARPRHAPTPPRFDRWPVALQHAMKLRGALVSCGPGLRGVGWPDNAPTRLAALAPWIPAGSVACHLTAAWVWCASRTPGHPLTFAGRPSRHAVGRPRSDNVRHYALRLQLHDVARLGEFAVTTPLRTVHDLLYTPGDFGVAEQVACRLLIGRLKGGAQGLRDSVSLHSRPHSVIARTRLERLMP